tara:strand:+ start:632 stop:766 length:135 start_codon:yes stop_codon:yes gene_type:complete
MIIYAKKNKLKNNKYNTFRFPKNKIGGYKCPVAIWNRKGKRLFL